MEGAIRGLDHIGITVPDLAEAEKFIIEGLGAEFVHKLLNRTMPPFESNMVEQMMPAPPGIKVSMIRMYRLGCGPSLELVEYDDVEGQRGALRGGDIGWQHIAVYVDDMEASIARAVAAGAFLLGQPSEMMGPESGDGIDSASSRRRSGH